MRDTTLVQMALAVTPPWIVVGRDFGAKAHWLHINIGFPVGSRFPCPTFGGGCPAYDTEQITWRSLSFFQHQAHPNACVPRIRCGACGIRKEQVQWGRPESGFTLTFKAMMIAIISAMPGKAVARIVGEYDTRLWRVVHHYVEQARARMDVSGSDPACHRRNRRKGWAQYVTLFVDIERAQVLFATVGREAAAVATFPDDLVARGGDPRAIGEVCIDMGSPFIRCVGDGLPNATITFDKFRAARVTNEAVDQMRRSKQRKNAERRGTRDIWLRNPKHLPERQKATLDALPTRQLKTARAYQMSLAVRDLDNVPTSQLTTAHLKEWYVWAIRLWLEPVIEAGRTVKRHWDGIL